MNWTVLGPLLLIHFFMACSITREIINFPKAGAGLKFRLLCLSWLVPLAGMYISHLLKFPRASGKWPHGERMGAIGRVPEDTPEGTLRTDHSHGSDNWGGDGGGHHD